VSQQLVLVLSWASTLVVGVSYGVLRKLAQSWTLAARWTAQLAGGVLALAQIEACGAVGGRLTGLGWQRLEQILPPILAILWRLNAGDMVETSALDPASSPLFWPRPVASTTRLRIDDNSGGGLMQSLLLSRSDPAPPIAPAERLAITVPRSLDRGFFYGEAWAAPPLKFTADQSPP